ncbi:MAG: PTS sugar transporter subunit IIC [Erysipelotrichaceae bacterium]|nr:PTS sugar transporter subunit IIC [Erysipelotrichaceae bacterium]
MSEKKSLIDRIEEWCQPLATFFGTEPHFLAIRDGVVASLPFTFIGGFAFLIFKCPWSDTAATGFVPFDKFMDAWWYLSSNYKQFTYPPYAATIGILSLFICFVVAYSLAQHYEMNSINFAVCATSIFLLVCSPVPVGGNITYGNLGSVNIFLAIIIAETSVELMRYAVNKGWTIHMPPSVPKVIENTFSTIFPFLFAFVVWYTISVICQIATGKLIPELWAYIFTLVSFAVNNPFMVTVLTAFENLLFGGFGIHPTTVTGPLLDPLQLVTLAENADAVAAGVALSDLPNVYTQSFWAYYSCIGGAGSTLALCIMCLRSKSKQLSSVGKVAIVPSVFNINEPVIFGLPIFLNPTLVIPFMLAPTFNIILGWLATSLKLVNKSYIFLTSTTPAVIGAFVATLDWRASILVILMFIGDWAIFYPFFKRYEAQCLKEEAAEAE